MLGWIMPRFNQFSVNRSYFSWLMGKKEYVKDAHNNTQIGENIKLYETRNCVIHTTQEKRVDRKSVV